MKRLIIIVSLILIIGPFNLALSKEIGFEASVDRNKVSLGSSVRLNLTFNGTQDIPAPALPEIDGFQSSYLGPSTRISIVNGRTTSSISHMYTLIPLRVGTFRIGPLSFKYKGDTFTSKQIGIEVIEGRVAKQNRGSSEKGLELDDRIFLVMEPEKKHTYLNESIPITIKLYVNGLSVQDIQYPEIPHEGFSISKFDKPEQYRKVLKGVIYNVIEFKTSIFGTRPGEHMLGPAQLKCNIMIKKQRRRSSMFDDFFGRYEKYPLNLKSEEIPMTVLALPEEGKPSDFTGTIGNFTFDFKAEPKEVKIGDPITLKMIIKGKGNLNTVTCPKIESQEGFKLYEPQIKQENNTKIFEQILMPKTDTIYEIPKVTFSFFDPERETYKTISKGPVPIKVIMSEKGEGLKFVELPQTTGRIPQKEMLGRDIIYIKESPGNLKRKGQFLFKSRIFLALQLLPLLLLVSIWTIHKRKERLKTDIRYARLLRAPKRAKKGLLEARRLLNHEQANGFYDQIFKTLQEYLGNKFHIPSGGITLHVVDDILKPKGLNEDILNKLRDSFKECDMARYAPSEFDKKKMEETFKRIEVVIDYLERQKL